MSEAVRPLASPHPRPLPEREGGRAAAFPTPELQYAPRPPLRGRRVVRRVILAVCLLVAVLAAVRWFPRVREHVLMLLWQRRCLHHQPLADRSVYTNDPTRSDALLRDGGYHVMDGATRSTFLVPGYWSDLYTLLSPPGLKSHGTVFLGRMTTPLGKERLVAVDLVVEDPTTDNVLLMARVIEPGTGVRRPRLLSTVGGRFLSYGLLDRPVTPGKVDPADPSRLLLFDGWIDGRLTENSLSLRPREPGRSTSSLPLTRPAPSSRGSPRSSAAPAIRPSPFPASR